MISQSQLNVNKSSSPSFGAVVTYPRQYHVRRDGLKYNIVNDLVDWLTSRNREGIDYVRELEKKVMMY